MKFAFLLYFVRSDCLFFLFFFFFFFQAEDGIRDLTVTGVQTCALPIFVEILPDDDVRVAAPRVRREDHERVTALLGDLQRVVRVAQREHRLSRRERLDHLGPAPGDDEAGDADALGLEELLLLGDEMLAVHEGGDAVRERDRPQALGVRAVGGAARGERDARGPGRPEKAATGESHGDRVYAGPSSAVNRNILTLQAISP